MIPKLTLDGGLLRESVLQPAVKKLKKWADEGKIELFESDRAKEKRSIQQGWPGGPPPQKPPQRYRPPKKSESGASFQRISAVLYPNRDTMRLNMTEVNRVAHLAFHHSEGRTIFVTIDRENFIADGRREQLAAAFKITVLTPEEAVLALEKSEVFAASEKKARDK